MVPPIGQGAWVWQLLSAQLGDDAEWPRRKKLLAQQADKTLVSIQRPSLNGESGRKI